MPEMKTLNGYEVVDAKARQDIEVLKNTEVDLTLYATKSELPTKVSQLQNDSRFITLEEVPETDLSAYAKKTDIPDVSGFITSIPSEYVTESELNAKGYLTQEDLPESIDTSRFLTKVDNNDQYMWYATTTNANQVIQNHVPIEKTDSKLDVVVGGKTLNNNTIAVREGLQIRVPEAPTNAGHAASKAYVDKAIAAIPEVDLSSYAKKSDIPTKTSQLANDSNYLTAIPSEYVTESELNAKGYLTEHQSLTDYATKTYVDNTVAENQPNLSGYAKKTDIPDVSGFISEIPSEYVTDSELAAKGYLVEADLSEYAKKSEIPTVPTKTSQLTNDSNFLTAVPAEYVTETELDNKGYLTEHQSLSDYAKKSEIPDVSHFITSIPEEYITETELNNKGYLTQHQSLEGYATKEYVDTAIAGIDIPGGAGGKKVLNLRIGYSLTASEKAIVNEILEYLRTGASDVMSKYEVTFRSPDSNRGTAYLVTGLHDFGVNRLRVYGQALDNGAMSYFYTDLYSDTNSSNVTLSCTMFASFDDILHLRWKQASGLEDSELYSATEIYVLGSDSGELSSCYAYLKTNSGPGAEFTGAQCIPLVSYRGDNSASSLAESNMPYIDWQGWGFNAHNFSVVAVFYKS